MSVKTSVFKQLLNVEGQADLTSRQEMIQVKSLENPSVHKHLQITLARHNAHYSKANGDRVSLSLRIHYAFVVAMYTVYAATCLGH